MSIGPNSLVDAHRARLMATAKPATLRHYTSNPRSAYGSADVSAQATAGWYPPLLSADAEWLNERDLSIARIRDLARNDGWAQAAIDRQVDMSVGASLRLNSKPDARALGISAEQAEELGHNIESEWRSYANDPTFRNDATRMLPVSGQLGLCAREYAQNGEGLAVLRWIPKPAWPYATALHVIDVDRLSNPYGRPDDDTIRGGVEIDENGAPIAYQIRKGHPGDVGPRTRSFEWERIPRFDDIGGWERPKVLHFFEHRRPGQHRGVSRLVAALVKMRLLSRYSESEVKAAAINGSIIGALYTELGPQYAAEALAGDGASGDGGSAKNFEDLSTKRAEFYGNRRVLDEARLLTLFPTDKMELNTTPRQVTGFPAFQTAFLQSFAASIGISYEQLSMDWSRTNYSSARAALNEVWRTIQRVRATLVWGVAQPFYCAWLEDAIDTGKIILPAKAPSFYDAAGAYSQAEWIGPGRGYVDPVKEAQASIMRIKNRLSTFEKEVADQGGDYRLVFSQLAREAKELGDFDLANLDFGNTGSQQDGEPAAALPAKPV